MGPQSGSGLGGGIGALLGGIFGGGGNPYSAAMGQMGQFPGYLQGQLGPYSQMGQQLLPQLQGIYGGLMNNPGEFLSRMGAGFQSDPGYQWNLNQNLSAGNKAQAAGGMAGTPQNQLFAQQTASGLANQQYQNYLNHAMGVFGQGLAGTQGLENQGFNASNNMVNQMGDYYSNMANMAAAKSGYQNQQGSSIGGLLGSLLGGFF